jgi:hypothetical protein
MMKFWPFKVPNIDMRFLSNMAFCSTGHYILVAAVEEDKKRQSDGVLGELSGRSPEGTLIYTR